jgi:hypothetical protein
MLPLPLVPVLVGTVSMLPDASSTPGAGPRGMSASTASDPPERISPLSTSPSALTELEVGKSGSSGREIVWQGRLVDEKGS